MIGKTALIYSLIFSICTCGMHAQLPFPVFLQGTWKVEGEERYEHWDPLHAQQLKGFSYTLKDGQLVVNEYLDLREKDGSIIYSASVPDQNNGETIDFILDRNGDMYSFENRIHDFPKRIIYKRISDAEIKVEVTDGRRGFEYVMRKSGVDTTAPGASGVNPRYDKALAEKLGGDEYGMKRYYFVLLRTGTNDTAGKEFTNLCFRGHMENMELMERKGHLIVAGPMSRNEQQYRGIFIINAASEKEVQMLLQNDAAIQNNLLQAEVYQWYGSAALPVYLDAADKIWKIKP